MPTRTDDLPDITRSDAAIVLTGRWRTASPHETRAAADAALTAWEHIPWPAGLLTHNVYVAETGDSVLHYSQWADRTAVDAYRRLDRSERPWSYVRHEVPGIERGGYKTYEWYRDYHPAGGPTSAAGCIVVVDIPLKHPDANRQRAWIDMVITALETDPEPAPGLISAHFHRSLDGARVLNYAQWTRADAHMAALADDRQEGIGRSDRPEWEPVLASPEAAASTFTRYAFHGARTV